VWRDVTELYDEAVWNSGTAYRVHPAFNFRVKLPEMGLRSLSDRTWGNE
jgi:hypothetical protein